MPTYDYHCANGHRFEEFQSIVAEPLEVCPICGGRAEREISGGSGLIFKGSGFYITDYAKKHSPESKGVSSVKSKEAVESAPAAKSDKSESKGETKSESRSETKSESRSESKGTSGS
ncbi:zinc ribbon domain-containing protein [candidate division KSB1 bacterium]|nr:zinc ribbon domain-containing protein [candidate division KSB1 bacterium]